MAEDKFYGSMMDEPRKNVPPSINYEATQEAETTGIKPEAKIFGRSQTTFIDEALAPSKVAKNAQNKPITKDDQTLLQKIMSSYNSAEQRDALENARSGIMTMLSSSLWQRITSNDYAVSEADKQKYISTVTGEIENMKQNRVKLSGTNAHIGSDLEQVNSRLGSALGERNGLRQEYRELKSEYEKTLDDTVTVKTKLEGCEDELKQGEFELQLHELKMAGGHLEDQLSEDHSKIEQYVVLIQGFNNSRTVLSAQKNRVSKELQWISTAIVGMDQTKKVLEYFFENQTGEIGLGLESEKRKKEIREVQKTMNNLMRLYHSADGLSQKISKEEEDLTLVDEQRSATVQGFSLPDDVKSIAQKKLGLNSIMELD